MNNTKKEEQEVIIIKDRVFSIVYYKGISNDPDLNGTAKNISFILHVDMLDIGNIFIQILYCNIEGFGKILFNHPTSASHPYPTNRWIFVPDGNINNPTISIRLSEYIKNHLKDIVVHDTENALYGLRENNIDNFRIYISNDMIIDGSPETIQKSINIFKQSEYPFVKMVANIEFDYDSSISSLSFSNGPYLVRDKYNRQVPFDFESFRVKHLVTDNNHYSTRITTNTRISPVIYEEYYEDQGFNITDIDCTFLSQIIKLEEFTFGVYDNMKLIDISNFKLTGLIFVDAFNNTYNVKSEVLEDFNNRVANGDQELIYNHGEC